jgi:hypothetical protein
MKDTWQFVMHHENETFLNIELAFLEIWLAVHRSIIPLLIPT